VISLVQISGIREDVRELCRDFREDREQIVADLKLLTGKVVEICNRLTRIEERLENR
jgi:hypothetical protein